MPAYVKTVYIYAPAFYAQTLITANVEGGTAIAKDDEDATADTRAVAGNTGTYTTLTLKEGWKDYLGSYNANSGKVNYTYKGSALKFSDKEVSTLLKTHQRIINSSNSCPPVYRASTDMYVKEDAEVAITLLGGNTCWNSSMGYYYYEDGKAPANLKDANVILIFPNTQDGEWENWDSRKPSKSAIGVDRGTAVQLMYYPNIASGSKEGATTVFPKGTRIGFALATNAWTGRLSGFDSDKKYRSATSSGLSVNNQGISYNEPRTAVYRYDRLDAVIVSFEDHTDDENFSDVVFTLKSNPVKAIEDIPVVGGGDDEEETVTQKSLKGVYAFEDLWPSRGDYDMNDAIVITDYEKTFDARNKISSEAFYFKVRQNVAANTNGLGVKLVGFDPSNAKTTLSIDGEALTPYKQDKEVFLLSQDIKVHINKTYKLSVTYTTPKSGETVMQPFIWRESDNGSIWEVHIAKEKPTFLMDMNFFGKNDDASDPEKGIFYVRKGSYPFAFFLAGATEKDINKILEGNDKVSIDLLYPKYNEWATSGGTLSPDWYKQ